MKIKYLDQLLNKPVSIQTTYHEECIVGILADETAHYLIVQTEKGQVMLFRRHIVAVWEITELCVENDTVN